MESSGTYKLAWYYVIFHEMHRKNQTNASIRQTGPQKAAREGGHVLRQLRRPALLRAGPGVMELRPSKLIKRMRHERYIFFLI